MEQSIINWILVSSLTVEFLLRVIPTKTDVSLFKVVRSILTYIHAILPNNIKKNGNS
jgi:hypothetical protein